MKKSSQSTSVNASWGMRLTPTSIKPLGNDLNNGLSLGLEYPLIWGYRPERRCYMLWDRHTGQVFAYVDNHHPNWLAELILSKVAQLQTSGVTFNPAEYDDVP